MSKEHLDIAKVILSNPNTEVTSGSDNKLYVKSINNSNRIEFKDFINFISEAIDTQKNATLNSGQRL